MKLATTLLLLLFTLLFAADQASFVNLGFSPDGRYFAFGQYGEHDGSGFPFAQIYTIDVMKNSYVKGGVRNKVMEIHDDSEEYNHDNPPTGEDVLAQLKKELRPLFTKLKISHTDTGTTTPNASSTDNNHLSIQTKVGKTIQAQLIKKRTPPSDDPYDSKIGFHIVVTDGEKSITVGNIKRIRGGVFDYFLSSVITSTNEKAVVCVVNKWSFGFEGPDSYYMVETLYRD